MDAKLNSKMHLIFLPFFNCQASKFAKSAYIIRVADTHHFDADPDPACHFDADPHPDPTFQFDANPDPDPTTHFFPDSDPPIL